MIAIVGGGIGGLATAYQLTCEGVAFTLFEASARLGGIVETVHRQGFVIECGPDSWVSEKPWARELAVELGLEDQIIASNDQWRRTYVQQGRGRNTQLEPIPDGMRMMVPARWGPLLESPLFSWQARLAYLREPKRAEELKRSAPPHDESVADFVRRHFGDEVAATIAGPAAGRGLRRRHCAAECSRRDARLRPHGGRGGQPDTGCPAKHAAILFGYLHHPCQWSRDPGRSHSCQAACRVPTPGAPGRAWRGFRAAGGLQPATAGDRLMRWSWPLRPT